MAMSPGARVRRYQVTTPLGAGGMGQGYLARDVELDRTIARDETRRIRSGDVPTQMLTQQVDVPRRTPWKWIAAAAVLLAAIAIGASFANRARVRGAARARLPQLEKLADERQYFAAWDLAAELSPILPNDPAIARVLEKVSIAIRRENHPARRAGLSRAGERGRLDRPARSGRRHAAGQARHPPRRVRPARREIGLHAGRAHGLAHIAWTGIGLSPEEARRIHPKANRGTFAPRVRAPKVMIHGRWDEGHPLATHAKPLFDIMTEPKRLVVADGGHMPPLEVSRRVVIELLDQHFGSVRRE